MLIRSISQVYFIQRLTTTTSNYSSYKLKKAEEIRSILSSPLWFNKHLRNENNLYVNNWYSKGIKTIGDILDVNGNFYTFDRLKEIYRVRGAFLNYENILQKIPNQWKNIKRKQSIYISK